MKTVKSLAILVVSPVLVALLCTAPLWTGLIGVVADQVAADRASAQAEENRAEADLEEARALADVLEKYTDVGVKALRADMYQAHPWLFLVDAGRLLLYVCAAVAIPAVLVFAVVFWRSPERALEVLFGLLERVGFSAHN